MLNGKIDILVCHLCIYVLSICGIASRKVTETLKPCKTKSPKDKKTENKGISVKAEDGIKIKHCHDSFIFPFIFQSLLLLISLNITADSDRMLGCTGDT